MEEDLSDYRVQNHGFGGSTDEYLYNYASRILYPYQPKVVFFQTGSNDYVDLEGTDAEKIEKCMAYKDKMFSKFHAELPNAKFVVMSGLLLPGRKQYKDMTMEINKQLKTYCEDRDYMTFVDASVMTYDETSDKYASNLFQNDRIHLNENGQRLWARDYIKPAIEGVIEQNQWTDLRK